MLVDNDNKNRSTSFEVNKAEGHRASLLYPTGVDTRKQKRWMGCALVSAVLLFVGAILVGVLLPAAIDSGLKDGATVCSSGSDNYDDWVKNTQSDAAHLYKNFYGFSIDNPEEYLAGEAAEVHEVGPFTMRVYKTNIDPVWAEDGDSVSYQTWSHFEYDTERSCPTCDKTDIMTNLNAPYLGLLGSAQSEGMLFLSTVCSTTQIGAIGAYLADPTSVPRCRTDEMGSATVCACCLPVPAGTAGANYTACEEVYAHSTATAGLFSLMAQYDGGYKVSDDVTAFGQQGVYSELVVSKTIREFGFGFPNALVGYVGALTAFKTYGAAGLAGLAAYTAQVSELCLPKCGGTFPAVACVGYTAEDEDIEDEDLKFLDETNCLPFTATYVTATLCQLAGLTGEACTCALGGSAPCCLSGGSINYVGDPAGLGLPDIVLPSLAGFGCLYEVKGYVDDRHYVTEGAYTGHSTEMNKEETGCNDVSDVQFITEYYDITSYNYWMDTPEAANGRQQYVTQTDLATLKANPSAVDFVAEVNGGAGHQVPPLGLTAGMFESHISDGKRAEDHYTLFVGEARRTLQVEFENEVEIKGIKANRFRPPVELLKGTDENMAIGAGVPVDGVQCLTYVMSFPAYVSRPLYLFGDPMLLNQTDNSGKYMTVPTTRGGINLYSDNDYSAPYTTLDTPRHIDTAFLEENFPVYDTYVDIEPASGKTINAHKRLMGSFSVWGCDLTRVASCGLFPQVSYVEGVSGDCYGVASGGVPYPCSAANVFSPRVMGDKIIPQYWMDENAELTDDQADTIVLAGRLNQASAVIMVVCGVFGFVGAVFAGYKLNGLRRPNRGGL